MHKELTRWQVLLWLGLTIIISFFANLGGVALFDLDEGAFSEATREMFVRGDFLSTYLNGEPRHDKPILIYWLQAASAGLFGFTEFAFRLPSALAASAWVVMIYYFVHKVSTRYRALLAAMITATCLEISVMGKAATADALLNFCITATMLNYFLYYRFAQKKYLYLFFLFMGLGFLTKGPVAVLIPAVVSFLFSLITGKMAWWGRTVFNPVGATIFCAVALPWYVVQFFKDDGAFIKGFFFEHNVSRFSSAMESHNGDFFYYVPVVILGVLPYTAALFLLIRRIPSLLKDEMALFLLLWFAFVFVFFSFSGTKLPHYVVYGYSAITILMAMKISELKNRWLVLSPILLFFLFILLLPNLVDWFKADIGDPFAREMISDHWNDWPNGYYWVAAPVFLISAYLFFETRIQLAHKLVLNGFLTALLVSYCVLPVVEAFAQAPVKMAANFAKEYHVEVVQWRVRLPSFNVYSETISPQRDPKAGDYVLTKSIHLHQLGEHAEIFRRNGIALVQLSAQKGP